MAKQGRPGPTGKKKKHPKTTAPEALRRSALRAVRRVLTQAEVTVRSIDAGLRKALKTRRRRAKARRRRKTHRGRAST